MHTNMLTGTFLSRYTAYIFADVEKMLKNCNVTIIKDPMYLNDKGESRFLMSAKSAQAYKDAREMIASMIGTYLRRQNQKLMMNRHPKAPPPLNIII